MKKTTLALAAAFLAVGGMPLAASAQDTEQADASEQRPYSIEVTKIGTLLDDPEAAAILERIIPSVYDNDMFRTMGRPNTLRTAQQYEAAVMTEEKMQRIQAEFDKLPAEGGN